MKNNLVKRLLATALALVMLMGMAPAITPQARAEVTDRETPLTFEAKEDGVTVALNNAQEGTQYKRGGSDWTDYNTSGDAISLNQGEKVQFRANGTLCATSTGVSTRFIVTGECYVYGNVMSLLDKDNFSSADSVPENAFANLFYNNTTIQNHATKNIVLPAETLTPNCYYAMFCSCTSLTRAPELPATTLATKCYSEMFYNCTSLTQAPELPAETLADYCYQYMFSLCESLTQAPALPATTLATRCYDNMFRKCTSLTQAPELPAETLADYCYDKMFEGCESLTQAPELPATTLAYSCYFAMFNGCTSLTNAPELPAKTLAEFCYGRMFDSCTSLTRAPELPARKLVQGCYYAMFSGCQSLNAVACLATNISAPEATNGWLNGVAATGRFIKAEGISWTENSAKGIPAGWLVFERVIVNGVTLDKDTAAINVGDTETLTATIYPSYAADKSVTWTSSDETVATVVDGVVTAVAAGTATITVTTTDGGFTASCAVTVNEATDRETPLTFEAKEDGVSVALKRAQSGTEYKKSGSDWTAYTSGNNISLNHGETVQFRGTGTACIYDYNSATNFAVNGQCYVYGNVMSLLYKTNFSSAESVPEYAFAFLFYNNSTILNHYTKDIVVPAATLADYCYSGMFEYCTSLTRAPELPATTLAPYCYEYMFSGCESLTSAPALPATTMADYCYRSMFEGCSVLTRAPELPATTLAPYCYEYMFSGCESLTSAPALPATTMADYCYRSMFEGCTSLTRAPELPAEALAARCYVYMFAYCASLTQAPELPATTLAERCYYGMFYNCRGLTQAPELPATTLAENCYSYMFYGCSSLNAVTCLATNISATDATTNWLRGVAAAGTFTKAEGMEGWPTGVSGIPTDWNVVDYVAVTVTFNSDGGTEVEAQTIAQGGTAAQPENPKRPGFTFLGWYNGENAFDFDTEITGNITLTAKWSTNTYHVTAEIDGETYIKTYEAFSSVKLTAPDKDSADLNFDHWEDEDGKELSKANPYSFLAREDVKVKAVFTEDAPEAAAKVELYYTQSWNSTKTKRAICLTTNRSAPDDWTAVEYGIYYATNKSLGYESEPDLNLLGEGEENIVRKAFSEMTSAVKQKSSTAKTDGKGTYFFNLVTGDQTTLNVYAIAYAIFRDENNVQQEIMYSGDIIMNNYDGLLTE